jgi:hypothetical protein
LTVYGSISSTHAGNDRQRFVLQLKLSALRGAACFAPSMTLMAALLIFAAALLQCRHCLSMP